MTTTRFKLQMTFIVILAVLIVAGMFISKVPTGLVVEETIDTGITWSSEQTRFVVEKDNQLELNLDNYFAYDKSVTVTYLATTTDKIKVSMEGSVLTIIPDEDFVGERLVKIIASDGENIARQEVKVEVVEDFSALEGETTQEADVKTEGLTEEVKEGIIEELVEEKAQEVVGSISEIAEAEPVSESGSEKTAESAVTGTKEPEDIAEEIVIGKNGKLEVNLSEYFTSYESTDVTYLTTTADDLSTGITGPILTIIPDEDFVGERLLTIIASDGENIARREIKIEVVDALSPAEPPGTTKEVILGAGSIEPEPSAEQTLQPEQSPQSEQSLPVAESTESEVSAEPILANGSVTPEELVLDGSRTRPTDFYFGGIINDDRGFRTTFKSLSISYDEVTDEYVFDMIFYHNSLNELGISVLGQANYSLSKNASSGLEEVQLTVRSKYNVLQALELRLGQEAYRIGKQLPVISFEGNEGFYRFINRNDDKIDVELELSGTRALLKGVKQGEMIKAKLASSDKLTTPLFVLDDAILESITLLLPKIDTVKKIVACPNFAFNSGICVGEWKDSGISIFAEDGLKVVFITSEPGAYGGSR